jgi:hypothetical protein
VREHPEAYLFDALVQLLTGTTTGDAPTATSAGAAAAPASSSNTTSGSSGAGAPDVGGSAPAPPAPRPADGHEPQPGAPASSTTRAPVPADPAATGDVSAPAANGAAPHTANAASDCSGTSPGQVSASGASTTGDPPGAGSGAPGSCHPAATGPPDGPATSGRLTGGAPTLPGLDVAPPPVPRAVLPSGANAKIIVRIDHTALVRGYPVAGETCEIDGIGTVDVASVQAWMTDAFVAAVLTDGTDITRVVHLGRRPTALQTTALQADGIRCARLGCGRTEGLQIDHRIDWSRTKHTRLGELDWLCRYDHSLKTLYGWTLEPGPGPRRMLPPPPADGHSGTRQAGAPAGATLRG